MENTEEILGDNLIKLLIVIHKYLHSLDVNKPLSVETALSDKVDLKLIKNDENTK